MKLLRHVIFFACFLVFVFHVQAAEEFKTDYTVDYYVTSQGNAITTSVEFTSKITNLQDDVYVSNYQLSFPASFNLHNIAASDDQGSITPEVKTEDGTILIKSKFNDPKNGKGTTNTLSLKFTQDNLFQVNGNVWEVMLPTIAGRSTGNYAVRIHLPPNNRKISIAKPKPSRIENNVISWDNPQVKTIYAVFGDQQFYNLDLSYHLSNDKLVPVYTEIALPPDTLYQQIFVESIEPPPTNVRVDEDGNYMARYDLNPKDKKDIRFKGFAQIVSEPREAVKSVTRARFARQKSYLLNKSKYWTISNAASYSHLTTPESVFKSVVGSLSYDYARLQNNKSYRLGADTALKNPTKAVCVEFTDTFIALARENNIYSHEIEGFGFSQDERLRPLSLISDVLHSWPEYYDESTGIWEQVDPTWENTSGIDYFSSFDLDHITFAIHGKDPEDPPPAGTYKLEDSRDVDVKIASSLPEESIVLTAKNMNVATAVSDKQTNSGSVEIVNSGNVTAYDVPITVSSSAFSISPKTLTIDELPPFGSKKITFTYALRPGTTEREGSITVQTGNQSRISRTIRISPFTQAVTIGISAAVALSLLVMAVLFGLHKKR
ncbi:hypothetical protein HYS00_05295 [Candidatus Microgenomates bacterium]|nr:hypothetical protein [Candidatus Microgenomates bacterium]